MLDISREIIVDAPADTVFRTITTQEGFQSWWTADSSLGENRQFGCF